jgi:recombinational DNA repair protein (RecF pathway)
MSYAIYSTEAIVLRLIPQGEANYDVVLFTRDLGKVVARAQSARKQESKMRMHLTRFRIVTVDIVRGKQVWRLTGITGNSLGNVVLSHELAQPIQKMFRLSEFLIQGEVAHPELFNEFKQLLMVSTPVSSIRGFEIYSVIQLLKHLGYWNGMLLTEGPNNQVFATCGAHKTELVKTINSSIAATQIIA